MPQVVPPLPYFFVGRDTATARIQKYLSEKHPLLSNSINKPETKTIWYSIDHLRKLMDEIEYLQADGLRIYLGMYEEGHPIAPGQLCLMMVPTRLNAEEKNEDVITEEEPDFSDRELMPKSEPEWKLNGSPLGKRKDKDYNYGSPCPPVCN
ncbi:MAG: hypothetical protein WCF67_21995, partial [Chitinophagaceae bacterium]